MILQLLASALCIDDEDPDALTQAGVMVAQCAADGGLAEALVRTALELAPQHTAAAATLAQLLAEHARLGVLPDEQAAARRAEARGILERALAAQPDCAPLLGTWGEFLGDEGAPEAEVRAVLEAAAAQAHRWERGVEAALWCNLAVHYWHAAARNVSGCAAALDRALAAGPDYLPALASLAAVRIDAGDLPGARDALARAEALAPRFPGVTAQRSALAEAEARARELPHGEPGASKRRRTSVTGGAG